MVTLVLLASISVFLLAMGEAHDGKAAKPSQEEDTASEALSTGATESCAIGSSSSSIPGTPDPITASLSDDQDHDGKYDGMADPLAVLCALIMLWGCFVLHTPLVGGLLLRLCEPPVLVGTDYCLALERPG